MKQTNKPKIIVYTVNLGNYDDLSEALKDNNVRYLYFTDQKKAPKGWELIKIETGGRKESRKLKINSHLLPEHDYSIYIDACYKIKKPLSELILHLEDNDIAISRHQRDNCVYRHAQRVIYLNLDNREPVYRQMERYKKKHMPKDFGLTENCLIIRKNNKKVKEFNELWWNEYQRGSQRDQLSCPYAIWKSKIKLKYLPFSARRNNYLSNWSNHLKSNKINT